MPEETHPKPLLGSQLMRRRTLKAEADPPATVRLNLATLRVPERTRANLAKVRGAANLYRLEAQISGKQLGVRSPHDTIPAEALKKASLSKIRQESADGLRHPWAEVKFVPPKVTLRANERSRPPAGVKLPEGMDLPCNVFAPDQRYIYQDTSFPWRTVGRVDSPLGAGTGCTIGARLLLTCSHVIQWNNDGTAGWVRFRPAYYNGSAPFGEAWATRVISWNKANGGDGLSNFETAFDYVVCVLDTRLGDTLGYPGYRTYDDDWNGGSYWQHMGYPSDLSGAQRPAFQGSCAISTVEDESTSGQTGYVLGHFNDVVPGHSGGPIWGWWDGEPWPRVVGVQSAEASTPAMNTSGDNEFGGGPALSSLISYARTNYP
ncbi:MAG: hypothetical protein IT158_30485 [Bryobacterales bacterium]|nr:hypothetical protein [Bryobacterales bacterium]